MSLNRVLGGIHGRPGRACALGFIFILVGLVPAAYVSQPDPLWIPGIYDGADGDDAIQAATSLESRVEEHFRVVSPASIIAHVAQTARPVLASTPLRGGDARSPPASACVRSLLGMVSVTGVHSIVPVLVGKNHRGRNL